MAMLAYKENLQLSDSLIAIYKIYVLKHPDSKDIFYVGITGNELKYRLSGHIGDAGQSGTGKNSAKGEYIRLILAAGKRPLIEEIEAINGRCYLDKIFALQRELHWMKHYKELGCNLTNSAGLESDGKYKFYQGYLASIQKGETSWHYYYCGKTRDGLSVYDKDRITADGFVFPEPPQPKESYNPWKNPRFYILNKIEDEKVRKPIITEIFPPQPQWSAEFKEDGLIYDDEGYDFWNDFDMEDYDAEEDSDFEATRFDDEPNNDEELNEQLANAKEIGVYKSGVSINQYILDEAKTLVAN